MIKNSGTCSRDQTCYGFFLLLFSFWWDWGLNSGPQHLQSSYTSSLKRPNLRIHQVEQRAEIQSKSTENIFSEIISENFPNLGNNMDTHVQTVFRTTIRHDQKKEPLHATL
jgi:hypothetical protein